MPLRDLLVAADELAKRDPPMLWSDVAPRLTCSEADALVTILSELGLQEHAHVLAFVHAGTDGPEDRHYQGQGAG